MTRKKRRSLDDQLANQTNPSKDEIMPTIAPAKPKRNSQPGSRATKKAISGFFEPEVSRHLKALAAMEDRTVQGMLGEALNLLFEKYGKDAIADEK